MNRRVERAVRAERLVEGEGFPIGRPFPTSELSQFDPFLLLDEMGPVDWPPGAALGAPNHPHAGFQAVTYLLKGAMEHRDSRGNTKQLGPGDAQVMTAGRGIIHAEMPEPGFLRAGGRMHGFQLWVNLPAADRDLIPSYQDLPASEIPKLALPGGNVWAAVLSGEVLGVSSQLDTRVPVIYIHFRLEPGGALEQPVPDGFHVAAYVFAGRGLFEGHAHEVEDLILFGKEGDTVRVSVPIDATDPLEFLLLGGRPVNEPVVRRGPFVASSRDELTATIRRYQAGEFGQIE